MKKLIILSLVLLTIGKSDSKAQTYQERVQEYVRIYYPLAIKNQVKYKIPASIILAQGILESNAGKGMLADSANNHFGIKCKEQWLGMVYYKEDDDIDTLGNLMRSCFRKYDSVEESFNDHAEFLKTNPRYAPLFELESCNYVAWATGLKQCGYATAANYSKSLIDLIERLDLFVFDRIDLSKTNNPYAVYQTFVFSENMKKQLERENNMPDAVKLPDYYQGLYLVVDKKSVDENAGF
ncbi:MAG TPA: glucosaminidase domain-containing protein [Saprospiraceae bacterium]|nr:glucosaminidase domain-containing protein [Saprospiraceae bacterium]